MEKEQLSKRLYVGGLGHTVSKAELQERFGKFGHVLDAEIITRKDDQGNPMKTFAYISVNISDADLRRCMSVLNKTKWKGGTLQIELARESFLHRLAVEREEAKLQKEKPQRNDKMGLLESMKKAGVADFHMKAVPGTEVPDHKKWVVGKFGRVLPILHLRSQQKNKIVKYDPSKYCHNLRKLDPDLTHLAPVSELTWHLEVEDDSISKKRRGEFPVTKKPVKKMKPLGSEAVNGSGVLSSSCQSHSKSTTSPQPDQRCKPNEKSKLPLSRSPNSKISGRGLLSDKSSIPGVAAPNNTAVSDSDIDSEEEIRAMVEREMQKADHIEAEDVETGSDHLEIVGDNFELKYNSHWSLSNSDATKKANKGGDKESVECDNGYDSADTDEIIAEIKTSAQSSRKTAILEDSKQVTVENKETLTNKKCDSPDGSSLKTCHVKEHFERNQKMKKSKSGALQCTAVNSTTKATSSESSSSEPEDEESDISSNYESMMQNCYRLDLTLDDLKSLATENSGTAAEESDSAESSSQHGVEENSTSNVVNNQKISKACPAVKKKKGICPEDVVAEILAGEENVGEENSKGQDNSGLKYQPFRGIGSLCDKEFSQGSTGVKKRSVDGLGINTSISPDGEESSQNQAENHSLNSLEVSSKKRQNLHCEQHKASSDAASVAEKRDQPASRPSLEGKKKNVSSSQRCQSSEPGDAVSSTGQSEYESSDTDSDAALPQKRVKQLKSPKLLSTKLKQDGSNKNPEGNATKCEGRKTSLLQNKELCLHATASREPSTQNRQLQDNLRRLAALEERRKERELQKKLIQGALSNLDSQPAGKHKHIVFNSDGESEAEGDEMVKDGSAPKTSCRLFESSEDEQDDADDEIFKIKPHFEGKAGEKLLQLQSRFGTDERFRMDARFLESDSEEEETNTLKAGEEEELAAEKKKNLQILGSLLNIDLERSKPNKKATNVKKFRDINALRYDPTREDHAVFERKPVATEKESKAKRKKKREENEKRPEVSKETYYDIAVDLKELLGSSKCQSTKNEEIPWDKEDLGPNVGSNTAQESSGFMFSFFGDAEELNKKEEPYVIESIKPVKVAWQEDPRFHDSSSEGDDEPEASESENDHEMFLSLPRTDTRRFFFFSKGDERLKEGPRLFCRSVDLSEDRDGWDERRRVLLEECRKKHKDARRKVRRK
ncbi:nucleolar protein 8 [Melanerpes formicivorus]|uniref:nucleolar protein 8 n=1 Tax=Melanerpes formicivorus TaxID=211600 RepID=UPI003590207C